MADVSISKYGNIFLFQALTTTGSAWIDEYINTDEAQFLTGRYDGRNLGSSLVVEHHHAQDIADGVQSDGLEVE